MPNTACSGFLGVCGFEQHFSGFEFFLPSGIISARPKSANANRWASGHVKFKIKKCLAGGGPCSAFRFWVSRFFKSCLIRLLESFDNVRWRVGESLGTLFCKPSLFGCLGLVSTGSTYQPARLAKFFTLWFSFWANRFGLWLWFVARKFS